MSNGRESVVDTWKKANRRPRIAAKGTHPFLDTRILPFYQDPMAIWHSCIEANCALYVWLSSVMQNPTSHSVGRTPCVFHSTARIGDPGHCGRGSEGELRVAGAARATSWCSSRTVRIQVIEVGCEVLHRRRKPFPCMICAPAEKVHFDYIPSKIYLLR